MPSLFENTGVTYSAIGPTLCFSFVRSCISLGTIVDITNVSPAKAAAHSNSQVGRHERIVIRVAASKGHVFEFVDRPQLMAGHMSRPSWRMGGGYMSVAIERGSGRSVGSLIRLTGRAFGIRLNVLAVVSNRVEGELKAWKTIGEPKLAVFGPYEMSVRLESAGNETEAEIDLLYFPPKSRSGRLLFAAFGDWYARWCVRLIAEDLRLLAVRLR